MRQAQRVSSRTLSALILVLGLAMLVSTLARGGEALALGVVLGLAFMGLGGGRLWLSLRS